MEREYLTEQQILEQYKKGKRDFSNIICNGAVLRYKNFRGIIFRNAILEGMSFEETDFTGADFSNAKITWCGIRFTKLKNAKFRNTVIYVSSFEGTEFENTDFTGADISNSNFMDTEKFKADFTRATLHEVFWTLEDFSLMKIEELISKLKAAGIPLYRILYIVERLREKKHRILGNISDIIETRPVYGRKFFNTYRRPNQVSGIDQSTYGGSPEEGTYVSSASEHQYGSSISKPKK